MKFIAVVSTLLVASASAFAPAASSERAVTTALNMDRRSAMGAVAAAGVVVAVMPSVASADGAISKATIQRSRYIYGVRITSLQEAVDKGDFASVAAEKNAFILYNSGAYPTKKQKEQKNKAVTATNNVFGSIRAKDAAALKTSFKEYLVVTDMSDFQAELDGEKGQGYSTDSDYRKLTKQGKIYVR